MSILDPGPVDTKRTGLRTVDGEGDGVWAAPPALVAALAGTAGVRAPNTTITARRWENRRMSLAGEFVTLVEIVPPKGIDFRKELEGARYLKSAGIDAINIPDSPRASARMSNQALSLLIQQQVGIEAVLHYCCRDRNVLGMQSDLLGASALESTRILLNSVSRFWPNGIANSSGVLGHYLMDNIVGPNVSGLLPARSGWPRSSVKESTRTMA